MYKNKVTVEIFGTKYYFTTDDDASYMEALAAELDERLRKVTEQSPRISVVQAAVVTALEFADEAKKIERADEAIKQQLRDYLDDAARAKAERDAFKQELEALKKQQKKQVKDKQMSIKDQANESE